MQISHANIHWLVLFKLEGDSIQFNSIQFNSIQVYLYSAFYDTNHYKATLQKIKFLQYLVVAYQ